MALTSKTVEAINQDAQGLPIAAQRVAELPVELGQFAAAIERVRGRVGFDQDPADFARARGPAKPAR
jgi:hypothetical protein